MDTDTRGSSWIEPAIVSLALMLPGLLPTGSAAFPGGAAAWLASGAAQALSQLGLLLVIIGARGRLREYGAVRPRARGALAAPALAVALIGTALALAPPEDILGYLNRTSFLGFAALSPLVFGGLYLRGPGSRTAALSLIAGQSTVVGLGLGLIRAPGIPDVFLAAGAAWMPFALAAVRKGRQAMLPAESFEPYRLGDVLPARWAVIFVALLLPAFDFWNWGKRAPALVAGLPVWVWISIAQGILLSLALAAFFRSKKPRRTS